MVSSFEKPRHDGFIDGTTSNLGHRHHEARKVRRDNITALQKFWDCFPALPMTT